MAAERTESITGLGPHGERAAPPSSVTLSDENMRQARERRFKVAIVFHTLDSDWSKQSMAGIASTLGRCAAMVTEVVDCNFDASAQIEALERIGDGSVDAVVSIPVGNAAVADAHSKICLGGKKLILHDNVPTGLVPGRDYTSLVSADNFGLGLIGAELLADRVKQGCEIGLLTYGVDFYATNEREIAFGRWVATNRPDLKVHTARFASIDTAAATAERLVDDHPNIIGLFVVWDVPAMEAVTAMTRRGLNIPVTTVDLGKEAATDLACNGQIVGIAAQQPHAQGIVVAQTALLSMLGIPVPGWVALPGVPVIQSNVVESFQKIWSTPAPKEILAMRRG